MAFPKVEFLLTKFVKRKELDGYLLAGWVKPVSKSVGLPVTAKMTS